MLYTGSAKAPFIDTRSTRYLSNPRPGNSARNPASMALTSNTPRKRHRAEQTTVSAADGNASFTTLPAFKVPGPMTVTCHIFKAPLDWTGEEHGEIELFVRELSAPNTSKRGSNTPCLLYLQGGPGFEGPRPTEASGWIKTAVSNFQVFLLDQRGTGRSSPITVTNLKKGRTPEQQVKYLSYFRADSIVKDAELIRAQLVPKDSYGGRWSILGQSFGGFCAFTYMSFASQGLLEVMVTGGIPPGIHMPCSAEVAYKALYKRVMQANERYYSRFPGDVAVVQRIVKYLAAQHEGGVTLPSGSLLTPRLFQTLGLSGLGSGGGFERLHYLLESFFDSDGDVTPTFLKSFEAWGAWETNPLYALLHEAIYCQGAASNWAAHRVREQHYKGTFDAVGAANEGRPVFFTGEMVFPWMFDDIAALRPYKATADLLAAKDDWGLLYNTTALSKLAGLPAASATYVEDMFVDYNLAQETAQHVKELRQWHTSEYKHSGIKDDGCRILERLLSMVRDTILLE